MTKSNSILLINPSFEPETASDCDLLIKVGATNFSYAIIDKIKNAVVAVYDEQECDDAIKRFAACMQTDHYLRLPYQQIKIAANSPNKIDIPNEFFNESELEAYTQYFIAPHTANIYANAHESFKLTTIFALSKPLEDAIENVPSKKYCIGAPLLAMVENLQGSQLLLDFTPKYFYATYVADGELRFQQGFEMENAEEFNYYLLLLLDQLNIDPAHTTIKLSGIIHEDDDTYTCIQKYLKNIYFQEFIGDLDQSVLDDLPMYYFTSLLALHQCE